MDIAFDPLVYYKSYPSKVILRPGYPARAQYKSTLMWDLYGKQIMRSLGRINSYADIGGCFGFGANAMAFHISKLQGKYPKTKVFEISSDFIEIGRQLFPYIEFVQESFIREKPSKEIFDLVSMFDVIEHIPCPESFLLSASNRAKFALLKTPMETGGDWFGAKPPTKQGNEHPDGHINFFTPRDYIKLLTNNGWELVSGKSIFSIVSQSNRQVLVPEDQYQKSPLKRIGINLLYRGFVPNYLRRNILGLGDYICLVKSLNLCSEESPE